jgi:hypothetical protein
MRIGSLLFPAKYAQGLGAPLLTPAHPLRNPWRPEPQPSTATRKAGIDDCTVQQAFQRYFRYHAFEVAGYPAILTSRISVTWLTFYIIYISLIGIVWPFVFELADSLLQQMTTAQLIVQRFVVLSHFGGLSQQVVAFVFDSAVQTLLQLLVLFAKFVPFGSRNSWLLDFIIH